MFDEYDHRTHSRTHSDTPRAILCTLAFIAAVILANVAAMYI